MATLQVNSGATQFPSHAAHHRASLLSYAIRASTSHQSLKPLIRGLQTCMHCDEYSDPAKATVFSCDSFCQPHLDAQLAFVETLSSIGYETVSFLNVPVSHYISSIPDPSLLSHCSNPVHLAKINEQLVRSQDLSRICKYDNVSVEQEYHYGLYEELQQLFDVLEDQEYKAIWISRFPFHELVFRDLSLTYKLLPGEVLEVDGGYYSLFKGSIQLALWLVVHLACQRHVGKSCYNMSFYSACGVFRYYCRSTGRTPRYFDIPFIDIEKYGIGVPELVRILDSPSQRVYITRPPLQAQLDLMKIKPDIAKALRLYVAERLKGVGSHTYSSPNDQESLRNDSVLELLDDVRNRGGKAIALFTSSDDESIGLQLDYIHEKVSVDHLGRAPFADQTDWIDSTIDLLYNHPKHHLFIRFHPRLAADKRGLPECPSFSAYWEMINKRTSQLPNVTLLHPSSQVSSYALGMSADLIINGWSTIGLELAITGQKVTNAFYRCTTGAAPIYNVLSHAPPLRSHLDYYNRILEILDRPFAHENSQFLISEDEAMKALLVFAYSGCIPLHSGVSFRAQSSEPQLLTSCFYSLFAC